MKKRFYTAGKFCIPDKSLAVGKENLTPLSALTERPLGIAVVFQYQFLYQESIYGVTSLSGLDDRDFVV